VSPGRPCHDDDDDEDDDYTVTIDKSMSVTSFVRSSIYNDSIIAIYDYSQTTDRLPRLGPHLTAEALPRISFP